MGYLEFKHQASSYNYALSLSIELSSLEIRYFFKPRFEASGRWDKHIPSGLNDSQYIFQCTITENISINQKYHKKQILKTNLEASEQKVWKGCDLNERTHINLMKIFVIEFCSRKCNFLLIYTAQWKFDIETESIIDFKGDIFQINYLYSRTTIVCRIKLYQRV